MADTQRLVHSRGGQKKVDFYLRLHALGIFPADAPATIRAFGMAQGQLTVEELVDRYRLQCKPVRDLLVDYLKERQPALDYASLDSISRSLAGLFWARIEALSPGIDTLRLPPDVARAWKEDLQTIKRSVTGPDGNKTVVTRPRINAKDELIRVRALYLDIAQWAMEEPGRWAQWAVPSPVSDAEINWAKERRRRKARMDQRTRERLPVLPVLARTAAERKNATARHLQAAMTTPPGEIIEGTSGTLRRAVTPTANGRHVWAEDTATGKRRNLSYEEEEAFWGFATIEVLRLTGIRCEELLELTHHGITEYRLPTTGELVPLLQIAPSKTDTERLLLVSPELADVLSAIISRLRGPGGDVPLTVSYDVRERVWNPPMPLLFQRSIGSENRAFTPSAIRKLLINALAATGLTDAAGDPLMFSPHDFRRIFVTDAIMSGLPPHIAQVICGHKNIDTTIGYKAVYPAEAIEAHRAFIARRRATRPSEEYRTPTDEEWDAFLARRAEARDFALWLKTVKKPARQRRPDAPAPGSVNPVTGKAAPGENYAARTRRHARTVIRSFYEYHREMHGRPLVNPFPQAKGAEEGQLNAHHNPMQPFRQPSRRAQYQPKEPKPAPRSIPDQAFNNLFAGLACNRDRALIAFYVSTGARASELLGVPQGLVAPEEQTIGVVRKGSRVLQHLPASTDAFVWLRLYQQEMLGLVPRGPDEPVWWTLPRPFRAADLRRCPDGFHPGQPDARRELDVA